MRIEIDRQLKIRLLNAIQEGVFDTDEFPELASVRVDWHETKTYAAPEKDKHSIIEQP